MRMLRHMMGRLRHWYSSRLGMIRHGYVPTLVIVCSCMGIAPAWGCSGMGIAPAWILLWYGCCSGLGMLWHGSCSGLGMLWHGYALTQIGYMTKNRIYGCDSLHTTRETIKIKLLNFFENFWGPKLKIWFIEILPIVERNILTKFGEDPLKTVGGVSSRSAKTLKN